MTVTVTETSPTSPPPIESSDSFSVNWDAADVLTSEPVVDKPDKTPNVTVCEQCGEVIERKPGSRGRAPKYHAECRPKKTSVHATNPRTGATKEAQAQQIVNRTKFLLMRTAVTVSVFDPFSGACIMQGTAGFCDAFYDVLIEDDAWRRALSGTSMHMGKMMLVFQSLIMLLPICARFGIIPSERMSAMLLQVPSLMQKLRAGMDKGEADMMSAMSDFLKAANGKPEGQ